MFSHAQQGLSQSPYPVSAQKNKPSSSTLEPTPVSYRRSVYQPTLKASSSICLAISVASQTAIAFSLAFMLIPTPLEEAYFFCGNKTAYATNKKIDKTAKSGLHALLLAVLTLHYQRLALSGVFIFLGIHNTHGGGFLFVGLTL